MAFYNNMKLAQKYIQIRPRVPFEIMKRIYEFHIQGINQFDKAVDVACGSGQNTAKLAEEFKNVIGIDISECQIAEAPKDLPNVTFEIGNAEDLSMVENNSVDLVSVSHGLHWFNNKDRFYSESKRILKNGGTMALFSSYVPLEANKTNQVFYEWYFSNFLKSGYYTKELFDSINQYSNINIPFKDVTRFETTLRREWSVDDFVDFFSLTSPYQTYEKSHPETDILQDIKKRLKAVYTSNGKEEKMTLDFPYFMILGRK